LNKKYLTRTNDLATATKSTSAILSEISTLLLLQAGRWAQ